MKNNSLKVKILNTIILSDNTTHIQRLTAIDLLKNIDPVECLKTVNLSYLSQSAKYEIIDNVNNCLKVG